MLGHGGLAPLSYTHLVGKRRRLATDSYNGRWKLVREQPKIPKHAKVIRHAREWRLGNPPGVSRVSEVARFYFRPYEQERGKDLT